VASGRPFESEERMRAYVEDLVANLKAELTAEFKACIKETEDRLSTRIEKLEDSVRQIMLDTEKMALEIASGLS
jgi:hypothetical protein